MENTVVLSETAQKNVDRWLSQSYDEGTKQYIRILKEKNELFIRTQLTGLQNLLAVIILVDIALDTKTYIKFLFGVTSPQHKQCS